MRATAWLFGLASIAGFGAGCGKQLNPEYCIGNPNDPDCRNAGLVLIDAAPRCQADSDCPSPSVCDTAAGACVQCTSTNATACTGDTKVCTKDDTCVQCVTGTDCSATSGVCLPDNLCAAAGTILYAAPAGSSTAADCTLAAAPCTLTNAVAHASSTKSTIQLATGTYDEGTITLGVPGLALVIAAGAQVVITGASATNNNPIFIVTANATMGQIELENSKGDGIRCGNNATLDLDQVVISNSDGDAVDADSCNVAITRSALIKSSQSGIAVSGTSTVAILNNFIYSGGSGGVFGYTGGGAVALSDHTTGAVRFNTIGFNQAAGYKLGKTEVEYAAGFSCSNGASVTFSDNLIVNDTPTEFSSLISCGSNPTSANWIGEASGVKFVSTNDPMNLHLTAQTPATSVGSDKAIRDNANTNCSDVPNDYDDDARPYNGACDYGADEFTPGAM